jgi:hypothetical protein
MNALLISPVLPRENPTVFGAGKAPTLKEEHKD